MIIKEIKHARKNLNKPKPHRDKHGKLVQSKALPPVLQSEIWTLDISIRKLYPKDRARFFLETYEKELKRITDLLIKQMAQLGYDSDTTKWHATHAVWLVFRKRIKTKRRYVFKPGSQRGRPWWKEKLQKETETADGQVFREISE